MKKFNPEKGWHVTTFLVTVKHRSHISKPSMAADLEMALIPYFSGHDDDHIKAVRARQK